MDVTLISPSGIDVVAAIHRLVLSVQPTAGDCIMAAQVLRSDIRDDTANGIDSEGNPFPAYSDGYAKQKSRKGGNASPVDLFGVDRPPHMLNSMLVRIGGQEISAESSIAFDGNPEPAETFSLGIYDEGAALRARIHNEGADIQTRLGSGKGKPKKGGQATVLMPRRHFFDASPARIERMERVIGERIQERLRRNG